MSSPPNALDAYRTYSYHHILIAADSTTTATLLSEENRISRFDHPEVRFCPQEYKGGKYVVLINGMTDNQFVVQSAKWSTVPIPTVGSATGSKVTSVQTMAVDGEIEILEPQGVNFFNVLVNVTRLLEVDPSLITFVLKTIFVGHRHDGQTTMITNIKPLMFMMVDISANIDVSGATYNMSLVGTVNGAAKMPHVNSIVSGLNLQIQKTLGETFDVLKEKIASNYDRMMEKLTTGDKCGVTIDPDEFTRVNYVFDLDDHYAKMDAGDHNDDKYRDASGKGGHVANLGESASIENIITTIMMSSSAVVKEAKGPLPDRRFMFKISSSVDTDAKTKEFTVTFHIHRYKAVVIPTEQQKTFEPEEGAGIVFDYIFTGKNIDIKEMDIKMEYGLMFFQVMAAEGTSPTSAREMLEHYSPDTFVKASGTPRVYDDDGSKTVAQCQANAGGKKIKRPLFLGTSLKHPMFRDTKSIGASASFNAMLNRHAAVENLGVKVTIRGNPQLLSDTTQLPADIATNVARFQPVIIPPDGDTNIVDDLRTIFPPIHKTPAYVKINVWAPNSWTGSADGAETIPASYQTEYAENLWYDGWYYLIQIDNSFEGGEFEQTMELLSLPTENSVQEANEECQEAENVKGAEAATQNPGSGAKPQTKETSKIVGAPDPEEVTTPEDQPTEAPATVPGNVVTAGSGAPVLKNSMEQTEKARQNNKKNQQARADQSKFQGNAQQRFRKPRQRFPNLTTGPATEVGSGNEGEII